MSMQLTQSMEVSILNILSIHTWTWLLLFSFTHFCSNLQFFPPPHLGKTFSRNSGSYFHTTSQIFVSVLKRLTFM